MSTDAFILALSCPDKPGIVARVSSHLFENGCNILDAAQSEEPDVVLVGTGSEVQHCVGAAATLREEGFERHEEG